MRLKLDEIIVIRNSFAHFRPLREDDIDVIRQNAKHALMGIENFLSGLTRCDDVVPSNSDESWYKELRTVGSDNVTIKLLQSSATDWVEIGMSFTSPALDYKNSGTWADCKLLKLSSPELLRAFPALREHVVYLTESQNCTIGKNDGLQYRKRLGFVFKKSVLQEKEQEIIGAFKDIVLKIGQELELLQQDDLARGQFLSVVKVWGYLQPPGSEGGTRHWSVNINGLASPPGEDDPPEYWGDLGWLGTEFITARDKYPWMSSTVSKPELW